MINVKSLSLLLTLLFSACSAPQTHFYALHASHEPGAAPGSYPFSLGVGPVFLPESMNQPGVVSYTPGQEVNVSTYHIWAGYLRENVTRVLADNLSLMLGADAVWPFPWDNRMRPTRQVRIVIEEMGGERGKNVTLQAKWALVADNGEKVLSTQRTRLVLATANDSHEAYIQAINQLLNQLSTQMASVIRNQQ